MTTQESITITPHWGDRARDAYWKNPTKYQMLALFAFTLIVGFAAAATL